MRVSGSFLCDTLGGLSRGPLVTATVARSLRYRIQFKSESSKIARLNFPGRRGLEACGSLEGLGRSKSSSARFLSFSGENSKNRALELFRLGQEGLEACGSLEGLGRSKSSSARFLSFSGAENSKNRALELFRLGHEGLEACGSLEGLGRSKSSSARFLSFSGG